MPVGALLPLDVVVKDQLAAALAEMADAESIGDSLPELLVRLLKEPLGEAFAEAVLTEAVGGAVSAAEALSKDAVALSEARPVGEGAEEGEAVGELERLADGQGVALLLRKGEPDEEVLRVGPEVTVAMLAVAVWLPQAEREAPADALEQPLVEALPFGDPEEDALREKNDTEGGAVALPLREGEADTEGHLLATAENEAKPEAVNESESGAVIEAQPLVVLDLHGLEETEEEGEPRAEKEERNDRDPLPVVLPLWLGEALEEPQRDIRAVNDGEGEVVPAGETEGVCDGLGDALREKNPETEQLPQGEGVGSDEALSDAVVQEDAKNDSVARGEKVASDVGEGVPVEREDALLVAFEEPLSKAVAVAAGEAEPLAVIVPVAVL